MTSLVGLIIIISVYENIFLIYVVFSVISGCFIILFSRLEFLQVKFINFLTFKKIVWTIDLFLD